MTTPINTQQLTRSSSERKTLQDDISDPLPESDKYARLEDLLRQILLLAGEIAENAPSQRPNRTSVTGVGNTRIAGECLVRRETSRTTSEPPLELRRQSSMCRPRRKLRGVDESEQESTSPSTASSMQEPFSPVSLAMSLDAIVEGRRSDIPLIENSSFPKDRLPESSPLTRVTTSHAPASPPCPTPGSTLAQDPMSQSATSAPIPIPGPPRRRPSGSRRISSPSPGSLEEAPFPTSKWHVRIVPVSLNREPVLSSSPPKALATPAFVKLEAMLPYRFLSDSHASARWSGEGSYIIIGRSPVISEGQSPLNLDECEHEFGPATESSLREFIENWEGAVDDLVVGEEWRILHAA